jgi:tRNA dimethylallyltransferase
MLYFKALFDGLDDMPPADAVVRAVLEQEAAHKGWPAMHAELALVDPVTAARLAPADSQRIQRALEVYRISGLPLSHFHSTQSTTKNIAGSAYSTGASGLISLEPLERSWLHARIVQRFDTMLEQGFVDEVRALRARGDLHADLPSMRCVGYRQVWEALDAQEAKGSSDVLTMTDVRELGIIATRQLAKRQITWLRSMPQRHIVAADQADALAAVQAHVRRVLPAKD